jgi:hypothetical protein
LAPPTKLRVNNRVGDTGARPTTAPDGARARLTVFTGESAMRLTWFFWLARHFTEYGYSQGLLRAAIGTGAVLVTAALVWFALHRNRPAAVAAAGLTSALGIGWLAFH